MQKGSYGYGNSKIRGTAIKTAICFVMVFGALIAGLVIFGNRKNIFTVISICMVLPAANFLVNLIVRVKDRPVSREEFERFDKVSKGLVTGCDLVLTANQKNVGVQLCVFAENGIIAYSRMSKDDNLKIVQMNLNKLCADAGIHHRFQLFADMEQFLKRVSSVKPSSIEMAERLTAEKLTLLKYSL